MRYVGVVKLEYEFVVNACTFEFDYRKSLTNGHLILGPYFKFINADWASCSGLLVNSDQIELKLSA